MALQEPGQDVSQSFNDWGDFSPKIKKAAKKHGKQATECVAFHHLVYKVSSPLRFVDLCEFRPDESSPEGYKPAFLSHARLYVFAGKWGIESLKDFVLQKLHTTLRGYQPYEARYGDVLNLNSVDNQTMGQIETSCECLTNIHQEGTAHPQEKRTTQTVSKAIPIR